MSRTTPALRWRWMSFGDHRLRYSVVGRGPAVVLPKKDIGDYLPTRLLADRYTLVQVEPLGFCRSDRPEPYPRGGITDQVLAVCDAEGLDEFAVWGFSQGGAMACAIARATPRARLMICGGFHPLRGLSASWLARMNREERVPLGSREFWNHFHRYDWHRELGRLEIPMLIYAGTLDRQCLSRADQLIVRAIGVDVITFDGLGHPDCGLGDPHSPATAAVAEWMAQHRWGSTAGSWARQGGSLPTSPSIASRMIDV